MADLRAKLGGTTASTGVLLMLAAASVALTACGGGGSGGGTAGLHAGGHAQAARSIPIAGSVTQSSDHAAGVTANSVTVTVEASGSELTPTIRSSGWGFDNPTIDDRDSLDLGGTTWRTIQSSRRYGDGSGRGVTILTDADPNNFDDDYLVMGYWSRVPAKFLDADGYVDMDRTSLAELVSEIEYGAFANGGDPYEQNNIQALTGTATYSGEATGAYIDVGNEKSGDLTAAVTLTADFGSNAQLGTISGRVHNFERIHDDPLDHDRHGRMTDAEFAQLGDVTLGTANIGDSDSGFFTGNTSMTAADDSLAGKWGGQFYGNGQTPQDRPGAVAGTFGATNGQKVVIGTYGARR